MTRIDNIPQEQKPPTKGEFFDAVRRHICQILNFDFGFIDVCEPGQIINVTSFATEDNNPNTKEFIESLQDENQQSVAVSNSHLAQKVRENERPWVGKLRSKLKPTLKRSAQTVLDNFEFGFDQQTEQESEEIYEYPYVIVPILQSVRSGPGVVKGLIRVISFDPSREISTNDVSTLRLMGEHLSTKINQINQFLKEEDPHDPEATLADREYVLIVHSDRLVRRRFSRVLSNSYHVLEAENSERALDVLKDSRVDLIIIDSEIQGTSGFVFCRVLKESPETKHLPVILVAPDTNPMARVEGLNAGADDCLSESCFDSELLARTKSSIRHRKTERELAIQLQLLEDYAQRLEQATEHLALDKETEKLRNHELAKLRWESDILRMQDTILHRISNTIRRSFNITENLRAMLEELSGWFNLDCCFIALPSDDEPEDSVRCEYATQYDYAVKDLGLDLKTLEIFKKHVPADQMIMVNDAANDRRLQPFRNEVLSNFHIFSLFYVPITYEQKLLGLLGGFKCESQARWNKDNEAFLKSVADQVAVGVTNARLYARVQRQATTDGLTGLYNHRTGQERLSEQMRLAERYHRNLAIVMIDVDHFKKINDSYGHPTGDTVLKTVARLIRRDCRDVDLPVRYGGEEFLVVLPEVNQDGACVVAERIRRTLEREIIKHEDLEISVTASIGVAAFPDDANNQHQLLEMADKALYLSKRLGRNQIHTAGDLMFEEISPSQPIPEDESDTTEEPKEERSHPAPSKENVRQQFTAPVISEEAKQNDELVPEVIEMVKSLATTLYSKSEYNKEHHLETAKFAEILAKVMGLSRQQVEQIRVASLLHDVGTLSLPQELMTKVGLFNSQERETIQQHPVLGAQILRPIRALRNICEILESHHERWDGTGYPQGLKGEQIPLSARIIAIVDSYHAMISDRPYRKAMTEDQAMQTLKEGAGTQWDPFLIDIFIAVLNSIRANQPTPPTNLHS